MLDRSYLNSPSCEVQFTNGVGRPFELIGDKLHEAGFPILQHTGLDHADCIRILGIGIILGEFYPAIAQNDRLLSHKNPRLIHVASLLYFFLAQLLSHNFEAHILLGPAHPDHSLLMQVMQMGKVHVCLVKDNDFPGADPELHSIPDDNGTLDGISHIQGVQEHEQPPDERVVL